MTTQNSYILRAPPLPGKELSRLGADFNHMLDTIAARDAALTEARDNLEIRVAERTQELELEVEVRRRAEYALQERTSFLNTLIARNPLAVLVTDSNAPVKLINPAFEKLFGYSQEECLGKLAASLIATGGTANEVQAGVSEMSDKRDVHRITRRRRKDGSLVDVELHGVPLLASNEVKAFLILYQDIHERLQAENRGSSRPPSACAKPRKPPKRPAAPRANSLRT